ncbi:MAG: carbohydrate ABC transporter permease [Actinomycetota bacterium]|nr:carbohydrate ABC transporter permease [Actinomycetota bacterium]
MTTIAGRTRPTTFSGRLVALINRFWLHIVLVFVSIAWLVPSMGLFVASLRTRAANSQSGWWTALWTGGWTTDNYTTVLQSANLPPPGFADNFVNTLIISIPGTLLPVAIAAVAAYAFAWMDFRGRDWIFLAVVALLVVPLQVTWVPVLQILRELGLTQNFTGIWLAHSAYGLPFAIFLLRNFFADLPKDLFESARIDGASERMVFFRIVLPLSVPALASLAIFQFVWVWNDLMNALIYIQDVDRFPLTVGIRSLLGQFGNEWHLLAAGAFISMSMPLLVFFSLQRYFVRGITAGAVKG